MPPAAAWAHRRAATAPAPRLEPALSAVLASETRDASRLPAVEAARAPAEEARDGSCDADLKAFIESGGSSPKRPDVLAEKEERRLDTARAVVWYAYTTLRDGTSSPLDLEPDSFGAGVVGSAADAVSDAALAAPVVPRVAAMKPGSSGTGVASARAWSSLSSSSSSPASTLPSPTAWMNESPRESVRSSPRSSCESAWPLATSRRSSMPSGSGAGPGTSVIMARNSDDSTRDGHASSEAYADGQEFRRQSTQGSYGFADAHVTKKLQTLRSLRRVCAAFSLHTPCASSPR